MSNLVYFANFYTSFFPLWLMIIIKNILIFFDMKISNISLTYIIKNKMNIELIITVVIIVIFILMYLVIKKSLKTIIKYTDIEIKNDKLFEEKSFSTEFIVTYILSILAFDFTKPIDIVTFIVFYSVLIVLCVKHNYFYINCFLELCGYRYYSYFANERKYIIITKLNLRNKINEDISIGKINEEMFLHMIR